MPGRGPYQGPCLLTRLLRRNPSPLHAASLLALWPFQPLPGQSSVWKVRSQVPCPLQVICGKCSEFKAENGRQSRVCRECFLTQQVAPETPSPEAVPEDPKHSTEVGGASERPGQEPLSLARCRPCSQSCLLPLGWDRGCVCVQCVLMCTRCVRVLSVCVCVCMVCAFS